MKSLIRKERIRHGHHHLISLQLKIRDERKIIKSDNRADEKK